MQTHAPPILSENQNLVSHIKPPRMQFSPQFTRQCIDITVTQIRHELNLEEELELAQGIMPLHETTISFFLVTGLELEESQ